MYILEHNFPDDENRKKRNIYLLPSKISGEQSSLQHRAQDDLELALSWDCTNSICLWYKQNLIF